MLQKVQLKCQQEKEVKQGMYIKYKSLISKVIIDLRNDGRRFLLLEMLQNLQRKAVQQQIEMETNEKKKVDQIRNTERNSAMEDLETWKNQKMEAWSLQDERGIFNATIQLV